MLSGSNHRSLAGDKLVPFICSSHSNCDFPQLRLATLLLAGVQRKPDYEGAYTWVVFTS